jgi:hypothetical protein
VDGTAGVGHRGRHAELGEHGRGRGHLGGAAHGVPGRAIDEARHAAFGELGFDVLAEPLLMPGGAGCLEAPTIAVAMPL